MNTSAQLSLFHVQAAYAAADRPLTNDELYESVGKRAGISKEEMESTDEIGVAKSKRSKIKRTIRWYQQTLKEMNLLQKVEGERGVWELVGDGKGKLHKPAPGVKLVAYSTNLGMAVWSCNRSFFADFNEPIHLCMTSPPYPLQRQRKYGNVAENEWVDFITESLEPIVKNLASGGSIVLNVGNDIFCHKSPARSLYIERMVLALHDRLGLSLMDRWVWYNNSKPPGPTRWASTDRYQLHVAWEPVFWFTNDPNNVRSNNQRVLKEHTKEHNKLMEQGGEKRNASYGDGANRIREGKSFSNTTAGAIPKNVIARGHRCKDSDLMHATSDALGLPRQSAMFPTEIPELAIKFLTQEDALVVDLFSGSNKTGLAAQRNNRRWLATEYVLEYIRAQAETFKAFPEYWLNPAMRAVGNDSLH